MNNVAEVYMWGTRIGIISLDEINGDVLYEYDSKFVKSGIEVSPIKMPLSNRVYSFPELQNSAFHGVPGMIADSLPDKFGNAVINQWLAKEGRTPDSFNVIERLCYTGKRGMGALEYVPVSGPQNQLSEVVDLDKLVRLASEVLNGREKKHAIMDDSISQQQLLKLGTSAGGARAKAIIAWNEETGDIRSGQIDAGDGYDYWIVKFDGVTKNGDHGIVDEPEYTLIEYAYYKMAIEAGIIMNECRVLHENGYNHFMTKRFDRIGNNGQKVHMQTLGALAHIDYNIPGLCSYEQAALYCRQIGLTSKEIEQLYMRMVFNVASVNQDDHVKNISFLMDKSGKWTLSPAYDITFSYNEQNKWLKAHQMMINGKSTGITRDDLLQAGKNMGLRVGRCKTIIDEVSSGIEKWKDIAECIGICESTVDLVEKCIKSNGIKQ